MSIEITNSYRGYQSYTKTNLNQTENKSITDDVSTNERNDQYLNKLNSRFPSLKIEQGDFLSVDNDHKISFKINTSLLEKMQKNPAQEKETMELLEGALKARNLVAALHKATGHEYVYSHDYIDENGQYWHTSMSIKNDTLNEELRKKSQEETEKRINDAIEKMRIKRKELVDMIKKEASEVSSVKSIDTFELSKEALKILKKDDTNAGN